MMFYMVFPGGSDGKESACNAGNLGSILGLGRSPGGGHGNALQYSCLENPMDRGAWQATIHGVAKSQTQGHNRETRLSTAHNHIKGSSGSSAVRNLPAMQQTQVQFLGREDSLEKETATHSSILPHKILQTEEPGGLYSPLGHKRFGRDLVTKPPPPQERNYCHLHLTDGKFKAY